MFTGTLSADTVTAIKLNPSHIVSGIIESKYIDIEALHVILINSENINALDLDTTRRKTVINKIITTYSGRYFEEFKRALFSTRNRCFISMYYAAYQ